MTPLFVLWLVQMWAEKCEVDSDESWGDDYLVYYEWRAPEFRTLAKLARLCCFHQPPRRILLKIWFKISTCSKHVELSALMATRKRNAPAITQGHDEASLPDVPDAFLSGGDEAGYDWCDV